MTRKREFSIRVKREVKLSLLVVRLSILVE